MRWVAAIAALGLIAADQAPRDPQADKALPDSRLPDHALREAVALARTIMAEDAPAVWPAAAEPPGQLILIDGEREFLFCAAHPARAREEGFAARGHDAVTGCDVAARPRRFAPDLLATFPAAGGVSTVVMGTPAATGYDLAAWTATLLHEHVHQMQASSAGYQAAAAALGLAGGDESGAWMLDYPFPYDAPLAADGYRRLAYAALDALDADAAAFPDRFATYARERRIVLAMLAPEDARYMELQLWQEGVARWSEAAIIAAAGPRWPHDPAWAEGDARTDWRELRGADLALDGRAAFYSLGAAEATLLERAGTNWRAGYLAAPFALSSHFPE